MESRDFDIGRVVREEKDRTVVFVVRIQNLGAREPIPPSLSVTVNQTGTVDLDVP